MVNTQMGSIQATMQSLMGHSPEVSGAASAKAPQDWQKVLARLESNLQSASPGKIEGKGGLENLTGLLRLQVDVSRVQMRVELLSKVAESAMASLRKFQQNQ